MTTNPTKRQVSTSKSSVIRWLLDSVPSIRWQVMRDLTDSPADEVGAERARVATEGAGARLLALQAPDGRWGGAAWNRGWDSTMHVLWLLREMGLDAASDEARRAVGLVSARVTWLGCGPPETDDNPFFVGEVEPSINWQVGAVGAYFGSHHPNESVLLELMAPSTVVIHHVSPPRFVSRVTLATCTGGTAIEWAQEFEGSTVVDRIRHIAEPANEQNLNRLQAVLAGEES
jgi:hypothetical protein